VQDAWEALEDTELLFMTRTGPTELDPAPAGGGGTSTTLIPTDRLDWGANPIADGPPCIEVALMRRHPATGEMSALVRETGANEYPVFEYHECVEEVFFLDGWLTLQNSETEGGDMRPGSYFWRPAYVTHGQSRSCDSLYYVYTDSALVNRRADGFHRTAQDNRLERERAIAAGAG